MYLRGLSPSQKSDIILCVATARACGRLHGETGSTMRSRSRFRMSEFPWIRRWTRGEGGGGYRFARKGSLLVLEEGILEGRKVFGNIIKYIRMGASSNFGNVFSMAWRTHFLPFGFVVVHSDSGEQSSMTTFFATGDSDGSMSMRNISDASRANGISTTVIAIACGVCGGRLQLRFLITPRLR